MSWIKRTLVMEQMIFSFFQKQRKRSFFSLTLFISSLLPCILPLSKSHCHILILGYQRLTYTDFHTKCVEFTNKNFVSFYRPTDFCNSFWPWAFLNLRFCLPVKGGMPQTCLSRCPPEVPSNLKPVCDSVASYKDASLSTSGCNCSYARYLLFCG